MNKIVFFENNTEGKICFFLLERFKYYYNSQYYCIEYDKECYEDSSNKLYYDKIDRMIKFCFSEHDYYYILDDNYYYLLDAYLLNTSKADSEKVINETKKYVCDIMIEDICKDITIKNREKLEELSKFSSREIVRFNNEDFTNFRKLFEVFAKKIAEKNNDLNTLEHNYKNNYVKYAYENGFEDYCIRGTVFSFENFSDDVDDYFMQNEVREKDIFYSRFTNILTEELEDMLKKKNIEYIFMEKYYEYEEF